MSGHLDGPPPGPPDPPYIPGDLGAPSAEEFARRRGPVSPEPERWIADLPNPREPVPPNDHQAWVVPAAAFDAVVAERDEARAKLGIAIDVTHEFEDEKIALADRLAKWERGVWPSTEAQHGALLGQIKELAAELGLARAALLAIAGDYGCAMREPADPSEPPREIVPCREAHPTDRSYWCDQCVASDALESSGEVEVVARVDFDRVWSLAEERLGELNATRAACEHLERALKHLREFVQDGEVRRIIDAALAVSGSSEPRKENE